MEEKENMFIVEDDEQEGLVVGDNVLDNLENDKKEKHGDNAVKAKNTFPKNSSQAMRP